MSFTTFRCHSHGTSAQGVPAQQAACVVENRKIKVHRSSDRQAPFPRPGAIRAGQSSMRPRLKPVLA
ncbi:hypothetical protein LJR296_004108 [Cupriavidus necator]|uniref:hypothetical protein n=1 Tax=Cupriavidus necator TaxID=106590 RepID=UPI003ECC91D3